MKKLLQGLASLAIIVVIFFVMFEVGSFIAVKAGWFPVEMPGYRLGQSGRFWKVLNPDFGVWHQPRETVVHRRSCFDVTYHSNAFGMRDAEVTKTGEAHRVVVLGDSFAEGWGVEYGKRFTELLERDKRVELLNFGTAGGFGSTQSYILYKTFASGFSHDALIFAMLPDNDFRDDRPPRGEVSPDARWKPLLVGDYPDYTLTYPPRDFKPDYEVGRTIEAFLDEFWITYRVARYYVEYFKKLSARQRDPDHPYAGYFDYSEEQFDRLRFAIEQMKAIAGSRPMLVITIPRRSDFQRANEIGGEPPIRKDLSALADELGIIYVDLMVGMGDTGDFDSYFHTCDGHWSPKGHEKAAEIIGNWTYFDRQPSSVGGKVARPEPSRISESR